MVYDWTLFDIIQLKGKKFWDTKNPLDTRGDLFINRFKFMLT